MSHAATNWAVEAVKGKGLNGNAKVVLWHLADRHHKDNGCFPSQSRLAEDCEVSRSQLNVHLDALEAAGLIRRERREDSETKQRRSTRYYLAFEPGFEAVQIGGTGGGKDVEPDPNPCPEIGHGNEEPMSGNPEKPCPENGESHVRNPDTNPVREPLREPIVRGGADEHTQKAFEEFWKIYPRPRGREETARLFFEAVASGVPPAWILASAKRYRTDQAGNPPMYQTYSDNWLRNERWTDFEPPALSDGSCPAPEAPPTDAAAFWAETINRGGYIPPSAISARLGAEIVGRGLATAEQMKAAGVRV